MRVFASGDSDAFDGKVNFVDTNNVYLGYDTSEQCCEYAGWFIDSVPHTDGSHPEKLSQPRNLWQWQFDPEYFVEAPSRDEYDEGGMAIFRITNGDEEQFIHLFNCHNGYYGHGFSFKIGDGSIRSGWL